MKNIQTEKDEEVGFIYVLKSRSQDQKNCSIENLYKIGYSKIAVEERIKMRHKNQLEYR